MNLWQKFKKWFTQDPVKEKWEKNRSKGSLVKVHFEFDNGLIRELNGNDANEWNKDIFMVACGRRVDWNRHAWIETAKPNTEAEKYLNQRAIYAHNQAMKEPFRE